MGKNANRKFQNIPTRHSEIDFIGKVYKWRNVPKKFDILVVKITKNGSLKNSKPCIHCLKYLKKSKLNINKVYYSTDKEIVCENLVDITNDYITTGIRRKLICK